MRAGFAFSFKLLLGGILSAAVLAVFLQSVGFDFVAWDDGRLIYDNPDFGGITWDRLQWMFTDLMSLWRYLPLTWLGWALNYDLGGLNPFGYHLGNVLLHWMNALLLFLVLIKFLVLCIGKSEPNSKPVIVAAMGATALWAIHPLRAEPVAWITDRVYCQSLFFLLLAYWVHLHRISKADGLPHRGLYWAGVGSYTCSLLSYQSGLGYFLILIILDFYPLRRLPLNWKTMFSKPYARIWFEKVPYCLIAVAIASTALAARFIPSATKPVATCHIFGIGEHSAQAFYVWTYFLWKPLAPFNLSPLYTTLLEVEPLNLTFLLSGAAVFFISAVLLWKRKKWPGLLVTWFCHILLLLPFSGLTEHPHFPSDRYSYFSSIAWCFPIAAGLCYLHSTRWRLPSLALGFSCLLVLGLACHKQVGIWRNSATLYSAMIERLDKPGYAGARKLYLRLALGYAELKQPTHALDAYKQHVFPDLLLTPRRRAEAFLELGCYPEAEQQYTQALLREPDNYFLHNRLGLALGTQGKFEEALLSFRKAAELNPAFPDAWQNIGVALTKQGKGKEAQSYLDNASRLKNASSTNGQSAFSHKGV